MKIKTVQRRIIKLWEVHSIQGTTRYDNSFEYAPAILDSIRLDEIASVN